jgi:hypothetical protein
VVNLFPTPPSPMKKTSRSYSKSIHEGGYVTDRRRLFRVLEIVPAKLNQRAAILEDCRTLDATFVPPKALKRMRLQLVQRAPVPSPA